ncbi:glucose-1-phosphate adenylyltransferase [Rhodocaloribacter litoris]|uniref:glucose-1-phosphate adenylyltransferase n=1 Tax=Rhodocaloribacter litoris TaxID=2558931 RepID=UPI0014248EBB|nr:glucose-1-phosphate adenylyltransferase [Rhodocaloribacter litoris]QXD15663.1 glucose-1-phosphate adenylyltransferase [Rhodocaloribacter litoris]GIV61596.1 MAG: glucose-1-phosphate adenylyltransferase [Rhodothermaceae bacterium]
MAGYMDEIIAIILGGGAGTRLFPLTKHRAKPAVPLAGKYRLIDVPISNCINSDISRIFVLTQFNSASLNRHIARAYRFDQFRQGFVAILAAEQTPYSRDWFQGTADAVRQSMIHVSNYRYDYVLILSGDQLYTMDYREMVEHHKAHEADITIATIPVTADEAPGFGILKTEEHNVISEFYEKPAPEELPGKESEVSEEMQQQGRIYLASMGIYVFSRGVLRELLEANEKAHDFGKEIIPGSIKSHRVVSFPFTGYWSDIGTIRSFYEANLMLARRYPDFDIYNPRRPLYTNARMLPPAKVQSSYIQDSIIAEASIIVNSQISNSVIGLRSVIGHNTTIKNTIFMGADYFPWHDVSLRDPAEGPARPGVDEESYIEGAIIDRNVSIGKRCIIKNRDNVQEGEGPNFYIRDGIVVIPKNVEIPDDTII